MLQNNTVAEQPTSAHAAQTQTARPPVLETNSRMLLRPVVMLREYLSMPLLRSRTLDWQLAA